MSIEFPAQTSAQLSAPPEGYRVISPLAVTGLVMGLLSVLGVLDVWLLAVIPPVGLLTSLAALRKIRRDPEYLAGERLAAAGAIASSVFLLLGGAWQAWSYATEVPEGFQRISFEQLQPAENESGRLYPQSAELLNGQRVYIKGYMYPGRQTAGIREFLLVWNNGDCCFGGKPPLTHMIKVEMPPSLEAEYTARARGVGGILRVKRADALEGLGMVVYQLEAEFIR